MLLNPPQQRARHGDIVARQDGTTAYSPIWNWPSEQVREYLAAHDIPINPAYDKLTALRAPKEALRIYYVSTQATSPPAASPDSGGPDPGSTTSWSPSCPTCRVRLARWTLTACT